MFSKSVGCFRETSHGCLPNPFAPRLRDCIADTPQQHEREILAYLRSGRYVIGRLGVEFDVLSPQPPKISTEGGFRVLTDGIWRWPSYLAYYVEHYHARLPRAFVKHMQRNNWKVPPEPPGRERP